MTVRRLHISGRVQGVAYRAWFKGQADTLGLFGWVRNRLNGEVEALIKGDGSAVDQMINLAHEGPVHARVDSVTVEEAQGLCPNRFEIKPTV